MVADVTAVGSLDRAEHAILEVIVTWRVFGQFRTYLWSQSRFAISNLLLSPKNFALGHLLIIEGLVADVAAFGSLERSEHVIFGVIVMAGSVFRQSRSCLWSGSHLLV